METLNASEAAAVVTVDVHEAKHLVGSGHRYLDVRMGEDFDNGHLENSLNIPYLLFTPEGRVKNPEFVEKVSSVFNKEDLIVVGCGTGNRSLKAATDLFNEGFKYVKNMKGGYKAWVENGFTVNKPQEQQ